MFEFYMLEKLEQPEGWTDYKVVRIFPKNVIDGTITAIDRTEEVGTGQMEYESGDILIRIRREE